MATDDNWYNSPRYYDLIFDEDTVTEADFIEAMMWQHGCTETARVLEPACGSGRLVSELARRGYEVDGFDSNENMLDFARERLVQDELWANLWNDSLQRFETSKTYDLAHCLVSTFKYLATEEDAHANLQRVADCLQPGGLYILGIHLSDYQRTKFEHERWAVERGGLQVVSNTRTWPPDRHQRTEKLRNRLRISQKGKPEKTLETHWQFRTYDAAQFRQLIASVAEFEVVACHDFNCCPGIERQFDDEYEDLIVVLRKRVT